LWFGGGRVGAFFSVASGMSLTLVTSTTLGLNKGSDMLEV